MPILEDLKELVQIDKFKDSVNIKDAIKEETSEQLLIKIVKED